jgi:hypothetical protein
MLRYWLAAGALALCANTPAFAQEEEIIVTGSRLESWERFPAPHAYITRRADFAVVEVEVQNDTRDAAARQDEIIEALRRLEASARRSDMTLALVDDDIDIVRRFSLEGARQLIRGGRRADTTHITVRVRTAVTATDTLESIHDRVERFIDQLQKPGRVEMSVGETDLSMVNLERYRGEMLREIMTEARDLSQMSGGVQSVQVGGLENQVAFKRESDLELVLFLPYELSVSLTSPQP